MEDYLSRKQKILLALRLSRDTKDQDELRNLLQEEKNSSSGTQRTDDFVDSILTRYSNEPSSSSSSSSNIASLSSSSLSSSSNIASLSSSSSASENQSKRLREESAEDEETQAFAFAITQELYPRESMLFKGLNKATKDYVPNYPNLTQFPELISEFLGTEPEEEDLMVFLINLKNANLSVNLNAVSKYCYIHNFRKCGKFIAEKMKLTDPEYTRFLQSNLESVKGRALSIASNLYPIEMAKLPQLNTAFNSQFLTSPEANKALLNKYLVYARNSFEENRELVDYPIDEQILLRYVSNIQFSNRPNKPNKLFLMLLKVCLTNNFREALEIILEKKTISYLEASGILKMQIDELKNFQWKIKGFKNYLINLLNVVVKFPIDYKDVYYIYSFVPKIIQLLIKKQLQDPSLKENEEEDYYKDQREQIDELLVKLFAILIKFIP